jgi:hypothetical protein
MIGKTSCKWPISVQSGASSAGMRAKIYDSRAVLSSNYILLEGSSALYTAAGSRVCVIPESEIFRTRSRTRTVVPTNMLSNWDSGPVHRVPQVLELPHSEPRETPFDQGLHKESAKRSAAVYLHPFPWASAYNTLPQIRKRSFSPTLPLLIRGIPAATSSGSKSQRKFLTQSSFLIHLVPGT